MKYRILVLLLLMCAVLVSAVGGTLGSYTSETALSMSIEPNMESIAAEQQLAGETPQTEDTESASSPDGEQPTDSIQEAPVETPADSMQPENPTQGAPDEAPEDSAQPEDPAQGMPNEVHTQSGTTPDLTQENR